MHRNQLRLRLLHEGACDKTAPAADRLESVRTNTLIGSSPGAPKHGSPAPACNKLHTQLSFNRELSIFVAGKPAHPNPRSNCCSLTPDVSSEGF